MSSDSPRIFNANLQNKKFTPTMKANNGRNSQTRQRLQTAKISAPLPINLPSLKSENGTETPSTHNWRSSTSPEIIHVQPVEVPISRAWAIPSCSMAIAPLDFPTAAETAMSKSPNLQAQTEIMNDAPHLSWDKMVDDDMGEFSVDVIEFEDGTKFPLNDVSPSDRFPEDYDRSYPVRIKPREETFSRDPSLCSTDKYPKNAWSRSPFDTLRRSSQDRKPFTLLQKSKQSSDAAERAQKRKEEEEALFQAARQRALQKAQSLGAASEKKQCDEPKPIAKNDEPKPAVKDGEPKPAVKDNVNEPKPVLQDNEPKLALQDNEPKLALKDNEPKPVLKDESETILKNDKIELNIEDGEKIWSNYAEGAKTTKGLVGSSPSGPSAWTNYAERLQRSSSEKTSAHSKNKPTMHASEETTKTISPSHSSGKADDQTRVEGSIKDCRLSSQENWPYRVGPLENTVYKPSSKKTTSSPSGDKPKAETNHAPAERTRNHTERVRSSKGPLSQDQPQIKIMPKEEFKRMVSHQDNKSTLENTQELEVHWWDTSVKPTNTSLSRDEYAGAPRWLAARGEQPHWTFADRILPFQSDSLSHEKSSLGRGKGRLTEQTQPRVPHVTSILQHERQQKKTDVTSDIVEDPVTYKTKIQDMFNKRQSPIFPQAIQKTIGEKPSHLSFMLGNTKGKSRYTRNPIPVMVYTFPHSMQSEYTGVYLKPISLSAPCKSQEISSAIPLPREMRE